MTEDHQLLATYTRDASRTALDALIRRHLPLVYSAARRQTRDAHLAEDVTHAVFLVLAQKARTIREGTAVGGWLLAVTRHAALNALKQQAIQKRHETMAATEKLNQGSGVESKDARDAQEWERVATCLDAEMSRLPAKDRDAIVLRFFENQTFTQIGATLAISDDTAQKRVARALEKLRHLLTRRGITLPAASLAASLATRTIEAAPAHLLTQTLAATAGTTTALSISIAKGTIAMMIWTKMKIAAALALAAILITGTAFQIVRTALAQQSPSPPIAIPATTPAAATMQANDVAARETVKALDVQWTFRATASLTDPVASKNVVYFGDGGGTVQAINAKDGAPIWRISYGSAVQTLVVDERQLYVASNKGIAALDNVNGNVLWELAIPHGANNSKIALWPATESLFVGGNDGLTYALDRRTGRKLWTHDIVEDAPADPPGFESSGARMDLKARPTGIATDGKYIYQSIFDQSRVIALDCTTGKQRWSFQARGWIFGSAAVNDKYVFVGSQDDHFYCLSRDDGKQVWNFTTRNRIEASPVLVGKNVCVAACDGIMYCADIATGKIIWKFQTDLDTRQPRAGRPIYSKPVVIGDTLYFAAGEGQAYALAADTGKLLWQVRPSPGSGLFGDPATDGERIFLTSRPTQISQGGRLGPTDPTPLQEGEASILALSKSPASAAPP